MNEGFIKLPRSLYYDPLWKGLPYTYRHVYIIILHNVVFRETTQDAFGVLIPLRPGQMLTTIRRLADLCDEPDIDRNVVSRSLVRFFELGFSRQDSRHGKTIITITRKDICDLIETRFETTSRQDRDIKEERKEREEKEHAHCATPEPVDPTLAELIKKRQYNDQL